MKLIYIKLESKTDIKSEKMGDFFPGRNTLEILASNPQSLCFKYSMESDGQNYTQ